RVRRRALGQLDPARREEGPDPVEARAAVDVGQVVALRVEGDERRPRRGGVAAEECVEERLPRRGVEVRREGDNAVQIEDRGFGRAVACWSAHSPPPPAVARARGPSGGPFRLPSGGSARGPLAGPPGGPRIDPPGGSLAGPSCGPPARTPRGSPRPSVPRSDPNPRARRAPAPSDRDERADVRLGAPVLRLPHMP